MTPDGTHAIRGDCRTGLRVSRRLALEDDEHTEVLVRGEAMVSAGLDEDRASLADRHLRILDLQHAVSLEHDVDLVVLVRLLAIGLRCDEHIHADLEPGGLVDDLVPSTGFAEPLANRRDLERVHALTLLDRCVVVQRRGAGFPHRRCEPALMPTCSAEGTLRRWVDEATRSGGRKGTADATPASSSSRRSMHCWPEVRVVGSPCRSTRSPAWTTCWAGSGSRGGELLRSASATWMRRERCWSSRTCCAPPESQRRRNRRRPGSSTSNGSCVCSSEAGPSSVSGLDGTWTAEGPSVDAGRLSSSLPFRHQRRCSLTSGEGSDAAGGSSGSSASESGSMSGTGSGSVSTACST